MRDKNFIPASLNIQSLEDPVLSDLKADKEKLASSLIADASEDLERFIS